MDGSSARGILVQGAIIVPVRVAIMAGSIGTLWLAIGLSSLTAQRSATPLPSGTLRGANEQTGQRLRELQPKIEAKRWVETLEELQRIIDEAGDDLVPLEDGHFQPARIVAQQLLATFPPEGQQVVRERTEGTARQLFVRAKDRADQRLLETILRDYPLTQTALEAGQLLGDLAFERGEWERAERAWRGLPRQPAQQARLILIEIFRQRFDSATKAIEQFCKDFPDAKGYLAGRDAPFADTLTEVLKQERGAAGPSAPGFREADWHTFAADPGRSGHLLAGLPFYWPTLPTWEQAIPADNDAQQRIPAIGDQHPRSLAFFPVVVGDRAYLADACRLMSWDLLNPREPTIVYDVRNNERLFDQELTIPVTGAPRYTLTYAEDMLFARFGATQPKPNAGKAGNWLVGLGASRNPSGWAPFWHLEPPEPEAMWEGTPIISDGKMFAAYSRLIGDRLQTNIVAYGGLHQRGESPELLWKRDVISTAINPNDVPERRELITLAGSQLVFCSHTGVIISLECASGEPVWAYRYPRVEHPANHFRDLSPPIGAEDRIFIAPMDSDSLFCLDAKTGKPHWRREALEVVQILGVASNRLIVTIGGSMRGIRGLSLRDGSDQGQNGWTQHDEGGVATYGRGLLAGERIFWPTRFGVYVLNARSGEVLGPTLPALSGNLTFARGVLLVTTATQIRGFVTERRRLPMRERAFRDASDDWLARYRYAVALADAGQTESARTHFTAIERGPLPGLADWAKQHRAQWDAEYARSLPIDPLGMPIPSFLREIRNADPMTVDADAQEAAQAVDARYDRLLRQFPTSEWLREQVRNRPEWQTLTEPATVIAECRAMLAALHHQPQEETKTAVRLTLAQAYEKIDQPHAARAIYQRLLREVPDAKVPAIVRERLEKLPALNDVEPRGGFAAPLERSWEWSLPRRERPLLEWPDTGWLCAFDGGICLRRADDGAQVWEVPLPFSVERLIPHADAVLALGPEGLALLALRPPQIVWMLHTGTFSAQTIPLLDETAHRREWSSFRFADDRLVARFGTDRLVAVDIESGWVDWWIRADSPGDGGFLPQLQATGEGILVQKANGDCWIVSPSDGAILQQVPVRREQVQGAASVGVPWSMPALIVDRRRLIVPSDAGQVRMIRLPDGKNVWNHIIRGESSRTGECSQVRRIGQRLLIVSMRNQGVELDLLEVESGQRLWPEPIHWVGSRIDVNDLAWIDDVLMVPHDGLVRAVSLANGRTIWQSAVPGLMPEQSFRLLAGRTGVIVIPKRDWSLREGTIAMLPSLHEPRFFMELGFRLLRRWMIAYDEMSEREWGITVLHPRDGAPLQRLRWTAPASIGIVLPGKRQALIAFGPHLMCWQ